MNKLFKGRIVLPAVLLLLVAAAIFLVTRIDRPGSEFGELSTGTIAEPDPVVIPEGVFYVRCSEPEQNRFSIQFIGAVPTRAVDYVGFEANEIYEDGTRGGLTSVKIRSLYTEVEDKDAGITLTPANFGLEEGFLFVRALDNIPVNRPGLAYEISAFYVVGNEKFYTAKQTFAVEDLLNEHILKDPPAIEIKEESPLIDVQNWVKYEYEPLRPETVSDPEKLSSVYYMGASAPDSNGNLDLYICFALPDNLYNGVGMRYLFSVENEERLTITTALSRIRTGVLYRKVYSEKDVLTLEDFGLSEGGIAVICFSDYVNTVLREGSTLEFEVYYTRNALETKVLEAEIDFSELLEKTVLVSAGISVEDYTYVKPGYGEWTVLNEAAGNAEGTGLLYVRVSRLKWTGQSAYFDVQLAAATETRFAERIVMYYTVYDKNGVAIPELIDKESEINTLYGSMFGNSQEESITSKDFGIDRGYLMTLLLSGVSLAEAEYSIGIRAVRIVGDEEVSLFSLKIPVQNLVDMIPDYGEK